MADPSELVVLFRSLNERAKTRSLAPEEQLVWSTMKSELIEALTDYAEGRARQPSEPIGPRHLRLVVSRSE